MGLDVELLAVVGLNEEVVGIRSLADGLALGTPEDEEDDSSMIEGGGVIISAAEEGLGVVSSSVDASPSS